MARLPEQRAWDALKGAINPWNLLLHRVENMCVDGMSDVIGINQKGVVFWVENKALADWPARSSTLPLADAFEPGQLPFMRQWKHWKGHAFVLLRVDKHFLLLDPTQPLNKMCATDLVVSAIVTGKQSVCEYLESLE
jgi:penicillin-binding protein-related factor A (putative recombinase)